jgi:hypothetical protein
MRLSPPPQGVRPRAIPIAGVTLLTACSCDL